VTSSRLHSCPRDSRCGPQNPAKDPCNTASSISDGSAARSRERFQAEPDVGPTQPDINPSWVGTADVRQQGKPVKTVEPFFSGTHLYEDEPTW